MLINTKNKNNNTKCIWICNAIETHLFFVKFDLLYINHTL